jgi:hypothetical protein
MGESSEPLPERHEADWAGLPGVTRGLLVACYFAEGVVLASLTAWSADPDWPVRVGIAAACLLPYGVLWRARPTLRVYLPGPLLVSFGLVLGMVPGVFAELLAERAGAAPLVAKALFVAVTAAGMAAVVRLAFRRAVG